MEKPIRVTHIITGLSTGGAEMMLFKLLSSIDRRHFSCDVISLTSDGAIGLKLRDLGVPVKILGMRSGMGGMYAADPFAFFRLVRWLRIESPDVVQTWMYHADLFGGLAARLGTKAPVVWNIRNYSLEAGIIKRSTRWIVKLCSRLSHWLPVRIVINSQAASENHIRAGYVADKFVVIPNGFDIYTFRPDPLAADAVKKELSIPAASPLIGMFARYDLAKDHDNFIQAAIMLHAHLPEVHFLLCGEGITRQNQELVKNIDASNLQEFFHLLGQREDVPRLMAALDIAALSSCSESFPNVVGEAMSCGIPCVVTDAGDSRYLVGETGKAVPVRQSQALSDAWLELLDMPVEARIKMGLAARRRIEEYFSLPTIASRYESLYREILAGKSSASKNHPDNSG